MTEAQRARTESGLRMRAPAASIGARPFFRGRDPGWEPVMRGTDLRRAARFNRWANGRLFGALDGIATDRWIAPQAGSFGNLRDTLAHVAEVDLLWIARAGRQPPATVAVGDALPPSALAERRRAIDAALVYWTEALGEDDLALPLAYRDTEGVERVTPLGLALAHMFDHQTFHRGEASAMLTALGIAAPALDMLEFFDEDGD
jgi:uncharacterized damage-inducible protein DinB